MADGSDRRRRIVPPVEPGEVADAVDAAAGRRPGSVLLRGGRLVNVLTGEIYRADVLLSGRLVAAVGDGFRAERVVDVAGSYIIPGLIDGHMHFESSLLHPAEYARAVVPRGVSAVVCDPHEMANVRGLEGVRFILGAAAGAPLDVFATASSCVPATPLETSGAALGPDDLATLLAMDRVVGVAELMNFPGMVAGEPEQLAKARLAERFGVVADGHAPGLRGAGLNAYVAAGVHSDHEATERYEAEEKVRLGMTVMIREGSAARNLETLLPLVTPVNNDRFLLVTDDVAPDDLARRGGIDHVVRRAIALGCDPVLAIRMATLNTARYFRLSRRGAVAPGYVADLAVVDSLADLQPRLVFKEGRLVAEEGELTVPVIPTEPPHLLDTVTLPHLSEEALALPHPGGPARVIGVVPGQIVTRALTATPPVRDGRAVADAASDLAKLAVIERHGLSGNVGIGLVHGFGLREGALASTVAHDSHNLIVCGMSDADMIAAARAVAHMGGGYAVVAGGKVLAALPLPIAGLLSRDDLPTVVSRMRDVNEAARRLGTTLETPFSTLSFLALTVIPELKLSDFGLIDVERARVVPFTI